MQDFKEIHKEAVAFCPGQSLKGYGWLVDSDRFEEGCRNMCEDQEIYDWIITVGSVLEDYAKATTAKRQGKKLDRLVKLVMTVPQVSVNSALEHGNHYMLPAIKDTQSVMKRFVAFDVESQRVYLGMDGRRNAYISMKYPQLAAVAIRFHFRKGSL